MRWQDILDAAFIDIVTLVWNRSVWRVLLQMLKDNPAIEHHSVVNDWLSRLYVTTQAVGIRRQRDRRDRPHTIGFLLDDIARHPQVLSDQRRSRPDDHADRQWVDARWARFVAGGSDHINPQVAVDDLARLDEVCVTVKRYVDRQVAHRDRDRVTTAPSMTYGDINGALDLLGGLLRRYTWLLKGTHLAHIGPSAGWGWLTMFAVPWLPEPFQPPDELKLHDVPELPDP